MFTANDDEQNIQDAIKAISVSKAAIEAYKKDIDKIKATISVYNELVSGPIHTILNIVCVISVCANLHGVLCAGQFGRSAA